MLQSGMKMSSTCCCTKWLTVVSPSASTASPCLWLRSYGLASSSTLSGSFSACNAMFAGWRLLPSVAHPLARRLGPAGALILGTGTPLKTGQTHAIPTISAQNDWGRRGRGLGGWVWPVAGWGLVRVGSDPGFSTIPNRRPLFPPQGIMVSEIAGDSRCGKNEKRNGSGMKGGGTPGLSCTLYTGAETSY